MTSRPVRKGKYALLGIALGTTAYAEALNNSQTAVHTAFKVSVLALIGQGGCMGRAGGIAEASLLVDGRFRPHPRTECVLSLPVDTETLSLDELSTVSFPSDSTANSRFVEELGTLSCDLPSLAEGWKLPLSVIERIYSSNPMPSSKVIEYRIAQELGGEVADSDSEPWDVRDADGRLWEVRALGSDQVKFGPSSSSGKGRKFTPAALFRKLKEVDGYIIYDVGLFPDMPYWKVETKTVRHWWKKGLISASGGYMTRAVFMRKAANKKLTVQQQRAADRNRARRRLIDRHGNPRPSKTPLAA